MDAFSARAALGKYIIVIPERDLVVAFANHTELPDVLQGRLMTTRKRKYAPILLAATRHAQDSGKAAEGNRRHGAGEGLHDFPSRHGGRCEGRKHLARALSSSATKAGITPGLYAVRLGGGTTSAVTFRA